MSNRLFQNIIFKDCGPRLNIDKVVEFEKKIGYTLPKDFRQFLCEINGGVSIKRGFQCANDPPPAPGSNYDPEFSESRQESDDGMRDILSQFEQGKEELQKELSEKFGVLGSAGLAGMLGKMLKMVTPSPQGTRREDDFYRNSFMPHIVMEFYHLNRPLTECITSFCSKAKIVDTPDIRSLVPFARATNGTLFISVSKDHFGHVFVGNFATRATPYFDPYMISPEDNQTQVLSELTKEFVASSFTEFLDKLFFAKAIFAEGYQPPKSLRRDYIDGFEDDPTEADSLILDTPDETNSEPKPKSSKTPASPEDFIASLKLKKVKEQYGPEYEWRGKIRLKHWGDFIESESARIDVQIFSGEKDEIPQSVYDALRYTMENQKKMKRKILQAVVDQIEEWNEVDDDDFEYSHISEIDDLCGSMTLDGISVVIPPDAKPVQVGYALPCEWSEEHGYAVLMCGDEIVEKGFADILFQYYEPE